MAGGIVAHWANLSAESGVKSLVKFEHALSTPWQSHFQGGYIQGGVG